MRRQINFISCPYFFFCYLSCPCLPSTAYYSTPLHNHIENIGRAHNRPEFQTSMVGELKLHSAGTEVADTRTRVNNETWRRERHQYLEAAGGGGALVKRDDAVLRGGDEVVEIRRLQRRREPARRHRGAGGPPQLAPGAFGVGRLRRRDEWNQSALRRLRTSGGAPAKPYGSATRRRLPP